MTAEQRKNLEFMLNSTETKLKHILDGEDLEAGTVLGLEIELDRLKLALQEEAETVMELEIELDRLKLAMQEEALERILKERENEEKYGVKSG